MVRKFLLPSEEKKTFPELDSTILHKRLHQIINKQSTSQPHQVQLTCTCTTCTKVLQFY